jgi:transposase
MKNPSNKPARYIGLDIHKEYFVATGINLEQEVVLKSQRVSNISMTNWAKKNLTKQDAVILEMTTNSFRVYDALIDLADSVTVVHPPHVALIARAQVKTDKRDSLALAKLHAANLLPGVWIPPKEVRDLRALIAQRWKMVRLRTISKNRLHAVLHRHQILPPIGGKLFSPDKRDWWLGLPLTEIELHNIESDLDTHDFSDHQVKRIEKMLGKLAAKEERTTLIVQVPGVSLVTGMTILAAIGDISRFPSAKKLVGYAGLGARVNQSGKHYRTGRITKTGRKDLRFTMVAAARSAARTHPKWKNEMARLEGRIGSQKAIIAIARKLLVVVWHLLTNQEADRFASPPRIARSFYALAFKIGSTNLPEKNARQYVRNQLDRLGIGQDLTRIPWGGKTVNLPPSSLPSYELEEGGSTIQ